MSPNQMELQFEPQEAFGLGGGGPEGIEGQPSDRDYEQKRELTCIEEELMDYSPTRSLPSLAAPS